MRISPTIRCRQYGLTIIELLVVITVALVICALIIQAQRSVSRKAQAAKCVANLRNIGTALNLYTADKGAYPGAYIVMLPKKQYWWIGLDEYVSGKNGDPSGDIPEWVRCPAKVRRFGTQGAGYGYNTVQFGYLPPTTLRPVQVTEPSRAIVLGDNADDGANPPTIGILHHKMFARRHFEGGNYLYADGHIEWKLADELAQEWNPKPFQ